MSEGKSKEEQRKELFDGVISALDLAVETVDHPDLYRAKENGKAGWFPTMWWGLNIELGEKDATYNMCVYLPEMAPCRTDTIDLKVPKNYKNRKDYFVDLTNNFKNALQEKTGHPVNLLENEHLY